MFSTVRMARNFIGIIIIVFLVVLSQGCQPETNLVSKFQYERDVNQLTINLNLKFKEIEDRLSRLEKK